MNQLTQKELERIISLYIDGELDPVESNKIEEYLATHPTVAREVEILRVAKRTLSAKEKLPKNNWFWLKLSDKIEEKESRSKNIISSQRPALAYSSFGIFTLFIIAAVYFKDAPLFHQFFIEKKNQMEQVYNNNIMTGNILPLFSNLNKEDVLNFALFGSITIDSTNNTSLQVNNTENKGSQIQIVKNESAPVALITMKDFAREIGFTRSQNEIVDSILGSYKDKLQTSVLVSENEGIAIHAELVDLNRAMVSTIAACLEPPQRVRFQKFLDVRKAPYTVVAVNSPTVPSGEIWNKIPKISSSNDYVVISPDTIEFAIMKINSDSIREIMNQRKFHNDILIREKMVAELTERQRRVEEQLVSFGNNRVRVNSASGTFQIHFEHKAPSAVSREFEMVEMVKPRFRTPVTPRSVYNRVTVIGDSAFSFEIPADEHAVRVFKRLPRGEFRFEIVDSLMQEPKMKVLFKSQSSRKEFETKLREMKEREEQLIDLDSLLKESEKQLDSSPVKPKKSGREIELEIMM